ncbi:MAG: hypothetical protein ABSA07_10910 [Acidimicrobiales bacterium]
MPNLHHYLLVFDHAKGELIGNIDFGTDSDSAVAAYAEKEIELKGQDSIEIVLIGSDSLDTIRITHANYFDGSIAVGNSKYLAGI